MAARRRRRSRKRAAARRLTAVGTHAAAVLAGAAVVALALWWGGAFFSPRQDRNAPDSLRTPPQEYAWTEQPAPAFPIPPYASYLEGIRIMLDPGHGGRSDRPNWKRGPTGLQEAEVNLRVALFLREFLAAVGADVHLTRDADVYLDPDVSKDNLRRIGLANELKADLFLSIHHNGVDRPEPNYTTLFYHTSPDESQAGLCAARHLLTGLNDALRLEQHLSCAVQSDRLLFENGLLVLREARVPAVLGEASFHSNPEEERRLRDPVYNRREAYGYFLGLARWAQAGLPRVRLLPAAGTGRRNGKTVTVALDDGLSERGGWGSDAVHIVADSIVVKVNGKPATFSPDFKTMQVRIEIPASSRETPPRLFVDFENTFGQHVLHPTIDLTNPHRE